MVFASNFIVTVMEITEESKFPNLGLERVCQTDNPGSQRDRLKAPKCAYVVAHVIDGGGLHGRKRDRGLRGHWICHVFES